MKVGFCFPHGCSLAAPPARLRTNSACSHRLMGRAVRVARHTLAPAPLISMSTSEVPSKEELKNMLGPGEVIVRFINTEDEEDVIAVANPGDNLLQVGDSAGLHIPRACQSGLCGSCTSDVVGLDGADSVETVRACQTGVSVPEGELEMVVDVWRVKEFKERKEADPMARFENLDTQYVAGAAPRKKGWRREVDCDKCKATGDILCYSCDGQGELEEGSYSCPLCVGSGAVRCAACQGTGKVVI